MTPVNQLYCYPLCVSTVCILTRPFPSVRLLNDLSRLKFSLCLAFTRIKEVKTKCLKSIRDVFVTLLKPSSREAVAPRLKRLMRFALREMPETLKLTGHASGRLGERGSVWILQRSSSIS